MATPTQSKYITDLAVLKTKEFKEVKELLLSSGIVTTNASTVLMAASLAEITNALTDKQASEFIDLLIATKEPARATVYAKRRVERTISILEEIRAEIDDWGF